MNCNDFNNNKCGKVSFIIRKTNSISGAVIPGAVFELISCNGYISRGATDSNGLLTFCLLPCNTYILKEAGAPDGYLPVEHVYTVFADNCGRVFVNGVPTSQLVIANTPILAAFTAFKVSLETGLPLAGAVYTLFMNSSQVASAVSDSTGQLVFTGLSPGTYSLLETTPPAGFQTNTESLSVVVAEDRSVTINGQPANGFIINNVPLSEFVFLKQDALTSQPLAGATFLLAQNGTEVGTAVSDVDGLVNFGVLAEGSYQLTETIPPSGYQPNNAVYQVVVGADGAITVDGAPLENFIVGNNPIAVSLPPAINAIFEGDDVVSGTGVPGASITVTFPDNSTEDTTVGLDGNWTVSVPLGLSLAAGDIVSAVQTEPGRLPSSPVDSTVLATVLSFLEKSFENQTSPGEAVEPGDVVRFTVLIGNLGGAGSVWTNATLSDFIDEDFTFVSGAVAIDGQLIPEGSGVGEYTYDNTTRALIIRVGDIASGEVKTVTFEVTVNLDAAGDEIVNNITALSLSDAGTITTTTSPVVIVV